MSTRGDVVSAGRTFIGTPFMHQGRLPGVALDCVGVVVSAARDAGLVGQAFDYNGYGRVPDGRSFLHVCDRMMTRIDRAEMQPADVIVVRYGRDPQHMGLLADYLYGGLSMIHALGTPDGKGRVVEHRLDESTLVRFVAAYRLPGVEP